MKPGLIHLPGAAVLAALLASCANKVTPSGGAKDIDPPAIVASVPENFSTGMSATSIRVDFDEYIKLTDLQKQLIISPIIDPPPKIEARKKSLFIEFERPLKPQTTYSLQFGSAIADIHEGNALEGFRFVFSTGEYLDSLSIAGSVVMADNLQPEKGVLVMLYETGNDTAVLKSLPDFFAKTDESGKFRIENLAAGEYKIHALQDGNGNYVFDPPDERVAFSERTVSTSDSFPVSLRLFKQPVGELRLLHSMTEDRGKLRAVFNTAYRKVAPRALGAEPRPWAREQFNIAGDTLWLWLADTTIDSLTVVFSENGSPFDTAAYVTNRKSGKGTVSKGLHIGSSLSGNFLEPNAGLLFTLSRPALKFDSEKIVFTADSAAANGLQLLFTDSIKNRLGSVYDWKEDTLYAVTFLRGAVEDLLGNLNDTTVFLFRVKPASDYGTLLLRINASDTAASYVVQLVSGETVVDERIWQRTAISFGHIKPGSYRLKIAVDENKNNRWDTGDLLKKIQPEKVFYYREKITIRANWDLEIDWEVDIR